MELVNHITALNMDYEKRSSLQRALISIGVHIYDEERWDSIWKVAHALFNIFIAISTFIFTTGYIIVYTEDVGLWIEGICIWNTGIIAYITIAMAWVFKKQFRNFLEEIAFKDAILDMPFISHVVNSSYKDGKLNELKNMVSDTQQKLLKYTIWLLKFYTAGVLSTAALYIIDTIYQMIITEDKSLRLLGFGMWFPWKLDDFNVYIATFIFHAYAGFISAMGYPGFQSTIVLLMGQIIRQLRILTYILDNLDDLIGEIVDKRDERWQLNCTSVLTQCVNHYIYIKKFSNRLNLICRTFYLAVIIDAMMLVCVCSVKIAINHGLSHDLIKYCLHELFFILMVLLFCFLGQQIQNECEHLEYAVTEKWYVFNKKHQNNVMLFHFAISQKMPIYIFGSIPLSLPTFTWFIKTGMSFFTLVMSVLED